jgi:hypothetical protein
MFPDLRMVQDYAACAHAGNKLGVGEKAHCRKMMKEIYHTDDSFFKEIDRASATTASASPMCRLTSFSFRIYAGFDDAHRQPDEVQAARASIFKKTIYAMTEKTVGDIFMKNDFKDPSVIKSVMNVRKYNTRLSFSQK